MPRRDDAKQETRRRLLTAAREVVAEHGAAALSLRDVARRAGVVPSAVYRHVDSRDGLLNELLVESYTSLADALEGSDADGWAATAAALRAWARERPHEFWLLYGTPVPGHAASEHTVPEAARIAQVFVRARAATAGPVEMTEAGDVPAGTPSAANVPAGTASGPVFAEALRAQLAGPATEFGADPQVLGTVLADLAQLIGLLLLEAGGHFVGTAEPADQLWEWIVARQGRG